MTEHNGKIYLVGAGPGDPSLITYKAAACIADADVVVYDYLAAASFLKHARPDAKIIYVGKKGGDHTLSQNEINLLLVDRGRKGLTVARLKGGDPFIFGRGGEEAEILVENNIPFEVVPGITSAIAAPAYAGIPLTHREYASSVSLVTGHEDPSKSDSSIQWDALVKSGSTLVFLMGVKNLASIVDNLLKNGKKPYTPVALVRWGTTSAQETVSGQLDNIVEKVRQAGLKAPAVIVVGEVVTLREKLKWFEKRPLIGKNIVITRARAQASDLVERLEKLGARCIETPTIRIGPPPDDAPLKKAVEQIKTYDWLVFTSVNGVAYFFDTLFSLGYDVRALGPLNFACIGPATKDKLAEFGIVSDILPETYRAESVVAAFSDINIQNSAVLLPRAREARTVLPDALKEMGARVTEVTAYETTLADEGKATLIPMLENREIDMITFTSSSTVKNFVTLLPKEKRSSLMARTRVACIGPITENTARELGIESDIVAEAYTIDGLVEAICQFYRGAEK